MRQVGVLASFDCKMMTEPNCQVIISPAMLARARAVVFPFLLMVRQAHGGGRADSLIDH